MPGAGRADVVIVDRAGEIWIVECKLARNHEIRRWVIGQVLSYAAALWKLDITDLERAFDAAGSSLTKPFRDGKEPGWDADAFRRDVSKNLKDGNFRLIIAVDEMDAKLERKLERAIAFLNYRTDRTDRTASEHQVLALVLSPGDDGEPKARALGGDSEAISPLELDWKLDRWSFLGKISDPDDRQLAADLLDWAEDLDLDRPVYSETRARIKAQSKRLFRISDTGEVRVYLEGFRERVGAEEVKRMKDALAAIDQRFETEDDKPTAPLDALSGEGMKMFLASMSGISGS